MAGESENIKFSKIAENEIEQFQNFPQPVLKIRDGYSGYSTGSGNDPVWGTDNDIDKVTLDGSDGVFFEDVIIETGTTELRNHMVGKDWTWNAWFNFDILSGSGTDYWMCINTDDDATNFSRSTRNSAGKNNRLLTSWNSSKLYIHTYHPAGSSSTTTSGTHGNAATGIWYMVTAVKTSSAFKMYLNGKLQITQTSVIPIVKNTDYWSIGQEWDTNPSDHMEGQVKKIMLWDVPLTEEQILHVYHLGRYSRTPYIVEDITWTTNGGSSNDQVVEGSRVVADSYNWHGWAASEPYMSTIGFECKRDTDSGTTWAMMALQRNGDSIGNSTTHSGLSYVVYLNSTVNGLYTYYNGGGQGTWWDTYLSPDSGSVGRSPNTDDKIKLMINQETNKVELSINDRIINIFTQAVSDSDYPFRVVATSKSKGFKECKFIKRNMVSGNTYTERADWEANLNCNILSNTIVLTDATAWKNWATTSPDYSTIGIQAKRYTTGSTYSMIGLAKNGHSMNSTTGYLWHGWKLYIRSESTDLRPRYYDGTTTEYGKHGDSKQPTTTDQIIKLLVNQNTQEVEIYIDDILMYTFKEKVEASDYPLVGAISTRYEGDGLKDFEIIKYKRDNEVNLKPIDKNPQAFDPVFDPPYTHHSQSDMIASTMGDTSNGSAGSIRNDGGGWFLSNGGWEEGRSIVDNGNTTHWYQINYSADGADKTQIAGVVTYGRSGSAQWVTKWKFQYSSDGSNWEWVDDGYEFDGHTHNDQRNMVYFASPVNTTGIRFFPTGYNGHPSARMALLLYKPNAPLYAIVDGHKSFNNEGSVVWENGAWVFNGSNYLKLDVLLGNTTYNNRTFVGKTKISFSCWFYKINQGSEGDVVYSCHEGTSNRFIHKINLDGSFHFYYEWDTVWKTRTGFIEDNKWYHYAFTRNDGTFTFYINGKKVSDDDIVLHNASATKNPLTGQPNYVYTTSTRFSIGQEWDSSPSDHWRGMIKNIYFWDREITEDEVYSVYHNFGISMNNFKRKVLKDYTIVPETNMSINSHFKNKSFLGIALYNFSSHTFTNCGATGRTGPTLANCTSTYSSTSWASNTDYFNMTTQGIQEWTVPKNGTYNIIAKGGKGGHGGSSTKAGGYGAQIEGDFDLEKGQIIKILVGQKGQEFGDGLSTTGSAGGAGGGGTFVLKSPYNSASSVLIIAGGGGGSSHHGNKSANATQDINARIINDTDTGGGGGNASYNVGGGGGLIGDGDGSTYSTGSGGKSFVNGGHGGIGGYSNDHTTYRNYGGFGGGGGNGAHAGGGGGGINGGTGGHYNDSKGGTGGASYNTGTSQGRIAHTADHGQVIITLL
tara:strand:- start:548 stop:4528 length:3981 start_codon:yes stop_codon:yes gene_type:complete